MLSPLSLYVLKCTHLQKIIIDDAMPLTFVELTREYIYSLLT
jgi:hypothetical protein